MISREGAKARRREDFKKLPWNASSLFHAIQAALLRSTTGIPGTSFTLSFLRAFAPSRLRVKKSGVWLLATACFFPLGCSVLQARDEITVSPKATFKVIQHSEPDANSAMWTASIQFSGKKKSNIKISDGMSWPALFYVSPDDQWILQIQKTGSGDNTAFLFRIEPNGRIWRMEETLYDLAFTYITQHSRAGRTALYHTGLEFTSWDLKAGLLRFSFSGSFDGGGGLDRKLVYDLKKHLITEP
jgi:hypothetical protein